MHTLAVSSTKLTYEGESTYAYICASRSHLAHVLEHERRGNVCELGGEHEQHHAAGRLLAGLVIEATRVLVLLELHGQHGREQRQ